MMRRHNLIRIILAAALVSVFAAPAGAQAETRSSPFRPAAAGSLACSFVSASTYLEYAFDRNALRRGVWHENPSASRRPKGRNLSQKRGRTDGPPGSHIGAGGYESAGFYRYSAELQFGAAWSNRGPLAGTDTGPPLSLGAVFAIWGDDWIRMDLSAHHLLHNEHTLFLVGPRFQSGFWPVSGYAGLKAGLALIPDLGPRFAVSPHIGAEMLIGDRFLLGIGWALEIPMSRETGLTSTHRPHMNLGMRF